MVKSKFCPPRETGEVPLLFTDGFTVKENLQDVIYEEVEDTTRGYVDGVTVEEINANTSGVNDLDEDE